VPILGNVPVVVPTYNEQVSIARQVKTVTAEFDRVSKKIGEMINALAEYKARLIMNAVTGKIDVRSYQRREAAE
jgi:type I restriction enzyme S subunit